MRSANAANALFSAWPERRVRANRRSPSGFTRERRSVPSSCRWTVSISRTPNCIGSRDGTAKGPRITFDGAGYVALLRRLRLQSEAEVVYAPTFERALDEPIAGAIPIAYARRLIVTEGNYLLLDRGAWSGVAALVDELWYVDVPRELRLQRLIARHVRFGRSEAEAIEWVMRTDEANAELIASTRERASRIVRLSEAD